MSKKKPSPLGPGDGFLPSRHLASLPVSTTTTVPRHDEAGEDRSRRASTLAGWHRAPRPRTAEGLAGHPSPPPPSGASASTSCRCWCWWWWWCIVPMTGRTSGRQRARISTSTQHDRASVTMRDKRAGIEPGASTGSGSHHHHNGQAVEHGRQPVEQSSATTSDQHRTSTSIASSGASTGAEPRQGARVRRPH